ncbi:MAG: ABC transporter permease, partial [Mesorhizobium sp.]
MRPSRPAVSCRRRSEATMSDAAARVPARSPSNPRSALLNAMQVGLPAIALLVMLAIIFSIRPAAMSYFGFHLLFKLSVPLVFAALAQMMVIMLGDIDLSNGAFVGLITCVTALYLGDAPAIAALCYIVLIAAYAGFGLLIHARQLPSIIVTLGMSFIWLGIAVILLPAPGGSA